MAIDRPAKRERGPGGTRRPGDPPDRDGRGPNGGAPPAVDGPKPGTGAPDAAVERPRGLARITRFSAEAAAELRKVSWPDKGTLLQATVVVLIVVAVIAAYLAVLDEIFERVVAAIF